MKVHLHQIPVEGLHVEGAEDSRMLDLHEPGIRPASEVKYTLDVGLSDGGLFATGVVGVDLELECVKCLEHFRYPLEVQDFACQVELTGAETVDLTPQVREDILLALPPHPHCDWNGERVCPGVFYRTKTASAESLADTPAVWGALDQLKLQK